MESTVWQTRQEKYLRGTGKNRASVTGSKFKSEKNPWDLAPTRSPVNSGSSGLSSRKSVSRLTSVPEQTVKNTCSECQSTNTPHM